MWTKNIDKMLIILQVLLDIYEKDNITGVRRSVLKERCEDQLNVKTAGEQVDYGGSFDRHLKELEKEKALEIIQKSKKKTIIIPNIARIKSLLTTKRLSGLLDESTPHFTEEEIQQAKWEKIIENEVGMALDNEVKELVQRSNASLSFDTDVIKKCHSVMREATIKIASSLASTLYEFYVAHKHHRFELDEAMITDLGILARRIASRDPTARFRLVIEYKGVPEDKNKLGLFLAPSMYKIIGEYFVKWARSAFNYEVNEDDKRNVSEPRIDLLSPETKEYYDIFSNETLPQYMRLWEKSNKKSYEKLSQFGLQ
jgi:hypothetical protein